MNASKEQTQGLPLSVKVVLCISVLAVLTPIAYEIHGHDSMTHLGWLEQFTALFRGGTFYPRWMPQSFYGFGSSVFYFYPPLPYWLASCLSLTGIEAMNTVYHVTTVILTILSAASAYFFGVKVFKQRRAAIWGALLYSVLPYRFVDMYVRNAIGEHAAFVFIPLILLGLYHIRPEGDMRRSQIVLWTAIGWAGILLSNIPSSVVMIYTTAVVLIFCGYYQKQYRPKVFAYGAGAILGMLIATVYLLPIGSLQRFIALGHLWDLGDDSLRVAGYIFIDVFYKFIDNKIFYTTLFFCFFACVSIAVILRSLLRKENAPSRSIERAEFWLLVAVIFFQIPYVTKPLWDLLPLMRLLQFSWRWDMILTVITTITIMRRIAREKVIKSDHYMIYACSAVTIAAVILTNINARNHPRPTDAVLMKAMWASEYLPSTVSGSMIREDSILLKHSHDPEIVTNSGSAASSVHREPFATTFVSSGGDYTFHRMFFPTWQLRDDRGVQYPLTSDSIGRMQATLPEGKRNYTLSIVKTNEERTGAWTSGGALILLIAFGTVTTLSRRRAASLS